MVKLKLAVILFLGNCTWLRIHDFHKSISVIRRKYYIISHFYNSEIVFFYCSIFKTFIPLHAGYSRIPLPGAVSAHPVVLAIVAVRAVCGFGKESFAKAPSATVGNGDGDAIYVWGITVAELSAG